MAALPFYMLLLERLSKFGLLKFAYRRLKRLLREWPGGIETGKRRARERRAALQADPAQDCERFKSIETKVPFKNE